MGVKMIWDFPLKMNHKNVMFSEREEIIKLCKMGNGKIQCYTTTTKMQQFISIQSIFSFFLEFHFSLRLRFGNKSV